MNGTGWTLAAIPIVMVAVIALWWGRERRKSSHSTSTGVHGAENHDPPN